MNIENFCYPAPTEIERKAEAGDYVFVQVGDRLVTETEPPHLATAILVRPNGDQATTVALLSLESSQLVDFLQQAAARELPVLIQGRRGLTPPCPYPPPRTPPLPFPWSEEEVNSTLREIAEKLLQPVVSFQP